MFPGSKHEWLGAELRKQIEPLDAHTPLSTERELAVRYQVSRATVRTALRGLEAAGIVYRVQGAGTFVSDSTVSKTLTLTSFSEDMRRRASRPDSRVVVAGEVPAGSVIGGELRLSVDDPVVRLVRLRLADDEPMCLETSYLPAVLVPGLLGEDLSSSLYEKLDTLGIRPVRAEQVVTAVTTEDTEAGLLVVPPGAPALRVQRIGLDHRDQPVERTTSLYRADRYDLKFGVRREPLI